MSTKSWKQQIRDALLGVPRTIKYPQISEESGVNVERIRQFASDRRTLNSDDLKLLDTWLVTKGYLTIAGGPAVPETVSEGPASYEIRNLKPFGEIAALVKHLAGVLTNETFSDKTRITLARNNVEPLLTALDEYEKILAQREASKQDKAG